MGLGCAHFGKNKSKIEIGNLSIEQHKEKGDEIIKVIKEQKACSKNLMIK
ncbi:hypothetical protein [Clostridium saccharoperbutylacetonicum]